MSKIGKVGGTNDMNRAFLIAALATTALAGCAVDSGGNDPDKSYDGQAVDQNDLANMQAGIWYSPQGCQYWIIDDGVEGYLSPRYNPDTGMPVCVDVPSDFPGLATGDFKQGSTSVIGDPI